MGSLLLAAYSKGLIMGQPVISETIESAAAALDDQEAALVLIKHDPITNYPWWARALLYFTYWVTEYSGEAQLQSICTTIKRAEELVEDEGYRGIWIPVNDSLPPGRCQWKPAIHFKSPLRKRYEGYRPKFIAIPHKDVIRELGQVSDSVDRLEAITARPKQ